MTATVDVEWKDQALCAELRIDTDLFYPGKDASLQPALDVCAACPVESECLRWALKIEGTGRYCFGVIGGKSAQARERLLGRRRAS